MIVFYSAIVVGVAMLASGAVGVVISKSAQATPAFTAQTKLPCTQCHSKPGGGANDLTDLGKKFHDNGNKMPK